MDTLQELQNIIQPLLKSFGVELVELQYNKSKRSSVRIFIWEDGGVSLDRCTEISRQVADILDRKDVISEKYILEVSSPGLDRPLKTKRDFERQIGRKVKAVLTDGDKTKKVIGKIDSVEQASVLIRTEKGVVEAPFDEIVSAKVVVEF